MNPLLQSTRVNILERDTFKAKCFADKHVLGAIETYDKEGSIKLRAHHFVQALAPLWRLYKKESYVPIFDEFVELEIGLEAINSDHSAHVNHVIQEFLFGFNIITNSSFIRQRYQYDNGRNDPESPFGELFFAWMAASLFHDVGYDIEQSPEEEAYREKKNNFWSFMTQRATTTSPLTFSPAGDGRRMIESYILNDIQSIPGAPSFSYVEFEGLFMRTVPDRPGWVRYDHGVISAVKYLIELEELEKKRGGNYMNWQPNRWAALAMALHNFRYKDCDLQLTCADPNSLASYLLIVSDEIQEWERSRVDADAHLSDENIIGKYTRKSTELAGIVFREQRCYVVIDHKLIDPDFKPMFEIYLAQRILLQKKHYPIRVLIPQMAKRIALEMEAIGEVATAFASLVPVLGSVVTAMQELTPKILDEKSASDPSFEILKQIAKTECQKRLLLPASPNPNYEVCVDHRIDGKPYLTVIFSL